MTFDEAQKKYGEFLKSRGLLNTNQRGVILREALSTYGHFSAEDLTLQMLKKGLKASRATVYRTLSSMQEAGILDEVDLGHGHIHYESPKTKIHHEHITCEKCGSVCEIQIQNLESVVSDAAKKAKFTSVKYVIRISGVCEKCGTSL
ncbi:transcriptional repressor [Fibrobacterales bacterium]|nr:transcriptional repressor [Fibrobacterales bacterium]